MRLEIKERIIFRVHPYWLYVVIPELILMAFGFLILMFGYLIPFWLLVSILGALLFSPLIIFLDWLCTNYYLPNLRLIEERGIIGKRVMFIPLDKVQDITCKLGILGRIFSFGDLEIESAGTRGKIVFNFAQNSRKLKEEIYKAILKFKANRKNMEGKEAK